MKRSESPGAGSDLGASAERGGRGDPGAVRALVRAPGRSSGGHLGPSGSWWRFEGPAEVVSAQRPADVPSVLQAVEQASREGLWAVGFVGYEASPAFDPAFRTHAPSGDVPVAWFGFFQRPEPADLPGDPSPDRSAGPLVSGLAATLPEPEYLAAVERVRELIALGETYQANLTYRLRGRLQHRNGPDMELGRALFRRLAAGQAAPYAVYLEGMQGVSAPDAKPGDGRGRWAVCSASPELFFERSGRSLLCRPMKGTAARGTTPADDRAAAERLVGSPKERAENVMIVDMIRNDLGRIARPGSVRVESLFRVERYPTLFQLTSDVSAESDASLVELFGALFPCASITGAPKVRTMEILRELESTPRGVYTGAIGFVAPGGDCRFSVAIRTAWVDRAGGSKRDDRGGSECFEYGTGSGVVWDSVPRAELAETRTKALILKDPSAETVLPSPRAQAWRRTPVEWPSPGNGGGPAGDRVRLLETLLWRPAPPAPCPWSAPPWRPAGRAVEVPSPGGFVLLERHLERLAVSARALGFAIDPDRVRKHLDALGDELAAGGEARRVRLLVDRCGEPATETGPAPRANWPWRVALARAPVDGLDPRLLHKTTDRVIYAQAWEGTRFRRPRPDDLLLWNREGELTESTVANLVLEIDGRLLTPRAEAGLLRGTYRAFLLETEFVREARLLVADLERADGLALVNSVRGWIPATLDPRPPDTTCPGDREALAPAAFQVD